MKARKVPLSLCWLLFTVSALRLLFVFDSLPDRMASHFDAAGQVDGYQSKAAFAATSVAIQLFQIGLFTSLPWLLMRAPAQLVNMPNRDYWLAPERRAATVGRLTGLLDWFNCATLALLAGTFELVLRANLQGQALDSRAMWTLLALYLAFAVVWSVSLWRAFRLRTG